MFTGEAGLGLDFVSIPILRADAVETDAVRIVVMRGVKCIVILCLVGNFLSCGFRLRHRDVVEGKRGPLYNIYVPKLKLLPCSPPAQSLHFESGRDTRHRRPAL